MSGWQLGLCIALAFIAGVFAGAAASYGVVVERLEKAFKEIIK